MKKSRDVRARGRKGTQICEHDRERYRPEQDRQHIQIRKRGVPPTQWWGIIRRERNEEERNEEREPWARMPLIT